MALADHVAQWSKDPSSKVGCVLVNDLRQVIGMGYNGFPRGVADTADRYEDRSLKYPMVVHAEANALLNATTETRGARAYVTHHPCADCTGLLIQAGISSIITNRPEDGFAERFCDHIRVSQIMLKEAGVSIAYIQEFEEIRHG
jgi:dCMP deaminase